MRIGVLPGRTGGAMGAKLNTRSLSFTSWVSSADAAAAAAGLSRASEDDDPAATIAATSAPMQWRNIDRVTSLHRRTSAVEGPERPPDRQPFRFHSLPR